ncbi:MAG TPA: hypothetical protein VD902_20225 [Symbiobacteriaceae bacterium]|nr:hypothetical protein [Symbiobacteriaceae bacterium]
METGDKMFKMLTDARAAAEPLGNFSLETGQQGMAPGHTAKGAAFGRQEPALEIAPGGAEAGILDEDGYGRPR